MEFETQCEVLSMLDAALEMSAGCCASLLWSMQSVIARHCTCTCLCLLLLECLSITHETS